MATPLSHGRIVRRALGSVILLLPMWMAGCIAAYVPAPHYPGETRGRIPGEALTFILIGTTSREDVLLRLGEPDAVARQSTVFAYRTRWIAGYGVFGIGLAGAGGTDVREEVVLIEFGDDQTVMRYEVVRVPVFAWPGRQWAGRHLSTSWSKGQPLMSMPYEAIETWGTPERPAAAVSTGPSPGPAASELPAGRRPESSPPVPDRSLAETPTPVRPPAVRPPGHVGEVRRVRVKPATWDDLAGRLLGETGLLRSLQRFDAEFEGVRLRAEDRTRLRALLPERARASPKSELSLIGTLDRVPFTIDLETDDQGRVRGTLDGLVFEEPGEAHDWITAFVRAGPTATLELAGYAGGRRLRVTLGRAGVVVTDRGPGVPRPQVETLKLGDALEVHVQPASLEDLRERLLGAEGLVPRGQRFEAEFEDVALTDDEVDPLVDLLRAVLRARPRSELELEGTLEGRPFTAKVDLDREGRGRLRLEGFVFTSVPEVDRFLDRFAGADGLWELTLAGTVAGHRLRRTWSPRAGP